MPSLALFPLGTTLLPGQQLPLQVFESRYLALLDAIVAGGPDDTHEGGFGVVAIRHGYEVGDRANELHGVGCFAAIDRIVHAADGLYFVLAHGTRRFRLDGVDAAAGTLWTTGSVTWLAEREGDEGRIPELASRLRQAVQAHTVALGIADLPAPSTPASLPYWAAEAVDLGAGDRQVLLDAPDTSSRLAIALRLVLRESSLASSLGVTASPASAPPNLN